MSVKMRLARRGRRKAPFYHIVIADARAPRDGRFIEKIGSYNPMTSPATIDLDNEKAVEWITKGAQPTDTMRAILRFKGVLYRMHLLQGVKKGALTQEKADEMYQAKLQEKAEKEAKRFEATADKKAAFLKAVSGSAKAPEVVVEAAEETQAAFQEGGEASTEQPAAEAESTPEEKTEE